MQQKNHIGQNHMSQNYVGANLAPWSWAWIKIRALRHIIDMFRLSGPIIASRLAGFFLVVVDTAMVSRYSEIHLQWITLGASGSNMFIGATFGFTVGVPILISRCYGAKNYEKIGDIWRQGLLWSCITGGIMSLLCIILAPIAMKSGDVDMIAKAYPIAVIYAISFVPNMIWMTGSSVLEATERPVPVFVLSIFGNIVNVILNAMLVYGLFFLPEMGAYGSALASLLVRLFMALITTLYLLNLDIAQKYKLKSFFISPFKKWKELRSQGYSAAFSIWAEATGWSLITAFSTKKPFMPADTVAWTANMNILATIFMAGLGLATATSVRMGIAKGRRDFNDQIYAALIGLIITLISMTILGLITVAAAKPLVSIFTKDNTTLIFAASFTIYLLWVFIPDCAQVVLAQALRASGIIWFTTAVGVLVYGILCPALAYYFAFGLEHGIKGLFEAIIVASWLITLGYTLIFIMNYKNMKAQTESGKEED